MEDNELQLGMLHGPSLAKSPASVNELGEETHTLVTRDRHHTINTQGTSGNAQVVNVVGDQIINVNDGLGAAPGVITTLESIEQRLKVVHDKELDDNTHIWLAAPNVSQNYNAARSKHQSETGFWFLHGTQYIEWKESPQYFLCIYGNPGCGKTILCSSIIEDIRDLCKAGSLSGYAYFFFDSRNADKGLLLFEKLLRSLLSQLASRCGGIPAALGESYRVHGKGREQPSVKSLQDALQLVIEGFDHVYIMIDSLDECGDKIQLLRWIETMASSQKGKVHLVLTSRLEPDITVRLNHITRLRPVAFDASALKEDIRIYIEEHVSSINYWSEDIKALVKNTLFEGADGMFRWVALQIDSLRKCLTAKHVKNQLKVLPKNLEETYERVLARNDHPSDLLQMLCWLAFSTRALKLEEIAETVSVDLDAEDCPSYDADLKYANPSTALTVCAGLVTETEGIVKLAHYSVKEYLISARIKTGAAAFFAIDERLSHSVIAQTCLAYLLIFNEPEFVPTPISTSGPFPLRWYAAGNLRSHLQSEEIAPPLEKLLLKFFSLPPNRALVNWMLFCDSVRTTAGRNSRIGDPVTILGDPLVYACSFGLPQVVRRLIAGGADVNLQHEEHYTALEIAATFGRTEIVRPLLDAGATADLHGGTQGMYFRHTEVARLLIQHGVDVNTQGEGGEFVLQTAVSRGNTELVKLLLDNGADINLGGGVYGDPFQEAISQYHTEVAQLLLEPGANANQGGDEETLIGRIEWISNTPYDCSYMSPPVPVLHAAAAKGLTEIIQLLLAHGADINLQGGRYGTALQHAVMSNYMETAKLLLESGADTNIPFGEAESALHMAVGQGNMEMVLLLLERGADVNIQGGFHGTALQPAALGGHTEIVKLLFDHGANVNLEGGEYGVALQAAAAEGRTEIAKLLLAHGGDVNVQGGRYGTALQAAATGGHAEIVQQLLERGAGVNIQGGLHGTALQAAALGGHTEILELFFDHGADVNVQGGLHGTALQAAALGGHTEILELFFDQGADVNVQGGCYGTVLQAAATGGHAEIVQQLLERGVDANIHGLHGTALQAAAAEGHTKIVKLLLAHGANVDVQGGYRHGTAVYAAAAGGHAEIVQQLLERGADVNIQGGFHGTALKAAAATNRVEIAKLLLCHGAEVNVQGGDHESPALLTAAILGYNEIVKLLLAHGAHFDISVVLNNVRSWRDTTDIERLLMQHGAVERLAH